MNELLQFLGSIASLSGIPLAIYLYLRSREAQLRRVREEIARILSYQIGDGRKLSRFEIETVIVSHTRSNRIREGKILGHEIVEDLVTDTIRNPMIPSERKQEIIDNLRDVYEKRVPLLTELHPVGPSLSEGQPAGLEKRVKLEMHMDSASRTLRRTTQFSTVFLATIVAVFFVFSVVSYFYIPAVWRWPADASMAKRDTVTGLLIGAGISLVSAAVALAYTKIFTSSR